MDSIKNLLELDFTTLIMSIFILMSGVIAAVTIIRKFFEIIGKPIRWIGNKNFDHELLQQTVKNLSELQIKHEKDILESIEHDKKIKDDFSIFMADMKNEMKQYTENRVNDRKQSFKIQKELTDSIKIIVDNNALKDKQINSLIVAQKEMLAEKINEKYKYYLSIKGIPEDEYDEFISLHKAYNGVNGNHYGDAKFEYCINHLPIIPVETKLTIKSE